MQRDATYRTKVGIERDAERIFVDSDGYLNLNNVDRTGEQLLTLLYTNALKTTILNSAGAGSGVLSTINLPSGGYIVFSIGDAASNASAWLTSSPLAGQVMFIHMAGAGSTGSVIIACSGVSLVGTISGDLSSISMRNSSNSMPWVKLNCFSAGVWSITQKFGGVTERPSA